MAGRPGSCPRPDPSHEWERSATAVEDESGPLVAVADRLTVCPGTLTGLVILVANDLHVGLTPGRTFCRQTERDHASHQAN